MFHRQHEMLAIQISIGSDHSCEVYMQTSYYIVVAYVFYNKIYDTYLTNIVAYLLKYFINLICNLLYSFRNVSSTAFLKEEAQSNWQRIWFCWFVNEYFLIG